MSLEEREKAVRPTRSTRSTRPTRPTQPKEVSTPTSNEISNETSNEISRETGNTPPRSPAPRNVERRRTTHGWVSPESYWERDKRSPRRRPLSRDRQFALLALYRDTEDQEAKDRLVESNMGLIGDLVGEVLARHERTALNAFTSLQSPFSRGLIDKEDLMQEGAAAFAAALDGFDPTKAAKKGADKGAKKGANKGASLTTYAARAVRNTLYVALERSTFIPVAHNGGRKLARYVEAREEIRASGREPTREELGLLVGAGPRQSVSTVRKLEAAHNLYRPIFTVEDLVARQDRDGKAGSVAPSQAAAEDEMFEEEYEAVEEESESRLLKALRHALTMLPEVDRSVLEDLFGLAASGHSDTGHRGTRGSGTLESSGKMTASAVARKHGICRSRVYQIRARALGQLKAQLTEHLAEHVTEHLTDQFPEDHGLQAVS